MILMIFVISLGTRSSPLTRNVANALTGSAALDFVEDVPDVIAICVRHSAVVVYDGSIRGTKVAGRPGELKARKPSVLGADAKDRAQTRSPCRVAAGKRISTTKTQSAQRIIKTGP
jgi:hypothetical protein